MSGLCTQANNGLVIDDPQVAGRFLTEWGALKAAGNGFPHDLVTANSAQQQFTVDDITVTPWFVPTSDEQDMHYARELIAGAKDAVFFLFFNPGTFQTEDERKTLLQNVLERRHDGLHMRGVVNQEIDHLTENPVTLVGPDGETPLSSNVLVPANIRKRFGAWEDEARGASQVMVHSKVIVLDPFGEHPVVMTGSHNLGVKASKRNDDNLVVLEGPAASPLAPGRRRLAGRLPQGRAPARAEVLDADGVGLSSSMRACRAWHRCSKRSWPRRRPQSASISAITRRPPRIACHPVSVRQTSLARPSAGSGRRSR
jgi:phosphatidylserine/phosphatidylglycerophosphate/cardiolipin synthase-like enzyme